MKFKTCTLMLAANEMEYLYGVVKGTEAVATIMQLQGVPAPVEQVEMIKKLLRKIVMFGTEADNADSQETTNH